MGDTAFPDGRLFGLVRRTSRMKELLLGWLSRRLLTVDLLRAVAPAKGLLRGTRQPDVRRLHLGCGSRRIEGWLNVDLRNSDRDVDLAGEALPWPDDAFHAAVAQHVIEPGGEVWLSCPDMRRACEHYVRGELEDLIEDRQSRYPEYSLGDLPSSHFLNELFHQGGEHRNLFDFDLLRFVLNRAGFVEVRRVGEADLLARFPGFPARHDDLQSLYVVAVVPHRAGTASEG